MMGSICVRSASRSAVQALVAFMFFALLGWSAFATARMMSAPLAPAAATATDMASLAAATELRARQIEQRQELLAAMLAGEDVGTTLPATTKISSLPAELAGPLARADDAVAGQAAPPSARSMRAMPRPLRNCASSASARPASPRAARTSR